MATYNPDITLFERQVKSLQSQDYKDWVCIISDDASDAPLLRGMEAIVADDKRFKLIRNKSKAGFYKNFERALASVPDCVRYIAMCDQDDIWHASKLSSNIQKLLDSGAGCVYSDSMLATRGGQKLGKSSSYRPLTYHGAWSLLSANVATGMTMMMTRDVLEKSLPFPSSLDTMYHDHWLALVASQTSGLCFIDEVLVDYTQHDANHTGALKKNKSAATIFRENMSLISKIIVTPIIKRAPAKNVGLLRQFNDSYRSQKVRYSLLLNTLSARCGDLEPSRPRGLKLGLGWNSVVFRLYVAGFLSRDGYRRGVVTDLVCKAVLEKILRFYIGQQRWKRSA